jgi:hypothetical protein
MAGTVDVIVFPDVFRGARALLSDNLPLLVTGLMEMDTSRGEPFLRAERVTRMG